MRKLKSTFLLTKILVLKPAKLIKEEQKFGADRYTKDLNFNESKFEHSQFTSSILTQNNPPIENLAKEVQETPPAQTQNNDDKIDELFGDNGL